jgi:cellulose synthase/poly-beta-1,6-N-acetylglucosamine synthase-like glycosyltransferase
MSAATFLVLAYRQSSTIEGAIDAAFAQKGAPLDIILSDDGSDDATFALMQAKAAVYEGPHKVRARRSAVNRGLVTHMAEAAAEAETRLVILAAGDDESEPDRAQSLVAAWSEAGEPTAYLHSDLQPMDGTGRVLVSKGENVARGPFSLSQLARGESGPIGATSAFTVDLIDKFPAMSRSVIHEDRVLPFRALLAGGHILFVSRSLVRYRTEGGVSRSRSTSLRDAMTDHARDYHGRLRGDAQQRLTDCLSRRPTDFALLRQCRRAITEHLVRVALANGEPLLRIATKALLDGARPYALARDVAKIILIRTRMVA